MKAMMLTVSSSLGKSCNVKIKSRRIAATSRNLVLGTFAIMGLLVFPMHLHSSELEPTQVAQASCGENLPGDALPAKIFYRSEFTGSRGSFGQCFGEAKDCYQ